MRVAVEIAVALLISSVAQAAEPPASATPLPKPIAAPAAAQTRVPLKLGIGDIRKYMMPNEFRAAVALSEAERNAIIVEGDMPAAPGAMAAQSSAEPLAWKLEAETTGVFAPNFAIEGGLM